MSLHDFRGLYVVRFFFFGEGGGVLEMSMSTLHASWTIVIHH